MQCDRNQIFTFLLVDFPPPPPLCLSLWAGWSEFSPFSFFLHSEGRDVSHAYAAFWHGLLSHDSTSVSRAPSAFRSPVPDVRLLLDRHVLQSFFMAKCRESSCFAVERGKRDRFYGTNSNFQQYRKHYHHKQTAMGKT